MEKVGEGWRRLENAREGSGRREKAREDTRTLEEAREYGLANYNVAAIIVIVALLLSNATEYILTESSSIGVCLINLVNAHCAMHVGHAMP